MASIAETLLARTARDGGCTVSLVSGDMATHTSGFYVGGVVPAIELPVGATLAQYVGASNRIANAMHGRGYVGTWTDGDTVYVDGSEWYADAETALRVGRERGELAVWEIAGGTSLEC